MSFWTLRVPGYAFWANQCTRYIPVLHEPYIQGSVKEISLGFLRRHLDLHAKQSKCELVFFDDILSIMEAQSLYAKQSKCEFGMTELLYLGHIISAKGVQVHQEKIGAILDWPTLKNVT
jgi:hypothetical protein